MVLAAAIIAMQVAATVPLKALSVCEVLAEDPARFNGETLSIRGRLLATQEGTWLTGDCKTHLITKGLIWGSMLWVYVDDSDEQAEHSWSMLFEKLARLHVDVEHDKIMVTIVGKLETRKSMDEAVYQMPYGPAKVGFGHLGAAPAEIDVISVHDLAVRRSTDKGQPKPKSP